MEKGLLALAFAVAIFSIPLFILPQYGKRRIRKEAQKRGWKIIKIKHVLSDSLALSIGTPSRTLYDVIYENEDGEIMNPNIYTEQYNRNLIIEQNYPIKKGKKDR